MICLRGAFSCGDEDVDIAATRVEAVCCFRARVRDVDHFTLNTRGASVGPAISVVTGLKQRIERDARIEVSSLWERGSVLQSMKVASARGERDAGARAIDGEDEPQNEYRCEEKNNYKKCSTARHRRQFRQVTRLTRFTGGLLCRRTRCRSRC